MTPSSSSNSNALDKNNLLFDFDGVIVNSFDLAYELSVRDRAQLTKDGYRRFFEGNIYAQAQGSKYLVPNALSDEWFAHYGELLLRYQCVTGVPELIADLSTRYRLFVVSSSYTDSIREFLHAHNLGTYFTDCYGGDIEPSKSVKIKMIENDYNITPANSIFITDTLGDIKEARLAAVAAIAVTWGYHDAGTLRSGNPYALVDSPQELAAAIAKYFS